MNGPTDERFSRQILLPGFGSAGQAALKRARVLMIGAGGLGCPALSYLAAAGIGSIGIVDPDTVSLSNLHRQPLYGVSSLGKRKAEVAKSSLSDLNPECEVNVFIEPFSVDNAVCIATNYDLIIDGTDSFEARYLINDVAVTLEKPFISAAVFQYEGQLSVFNGCGRDGSRGPTYRCLYPNIPSAAAIPNCAEAGVLPTLPGILGVLQAQEAIKLVTGIGEVLIGRLLCVDTQSGEWRIRRFFRNDAIVRETRVGDKAAYQMTRCGAIQTVKTLSPRALQTMLSCGGVTLVDVRELAEREFGNIGGLHIPVAEVKQRCHEIPRTHPIVLYCKGGVRSLSAAQVVVENTGLENVFSLEGGIAAWRDDIDHTVCVA